jgi:midasin
MNLMGGKKGGSRPQEIRAHSDFRILATMNPGGDFGKRELSPALRNRFTEIWVPPVSSEADVSTVVGGRLKVYFFFFCCFSSPYWTECVCS